MRKHILLAKKRRIADNFIWYIKITPDQLSIFSEKQLMELSLILAESEKFRESCNPWYSLDVNRAIRKPISGEPEVVVEVNGLSAKVLTQEEIKMTSASSVFNRYNKEK